MKGELIERTIKVHIFKFEDGTEIDADIIKEFLEDAYEFEDTINASGNYTDRYLYFVTNKEKPLEKVLLDLDVIRLSPYYEYVNKNVGKDIFCKHYHYWLSNGYHKFVEMYWDYMNKV
jgi:hypothetical protein